MGCDIHTLVEVRDNGRWIYLPLDYEPFDTRSYGMFGFFADVRNYSFVPSIQSKRLGLPDDASREAKARFPLNSYYHSMTHVTLKQLIDFDYSQTFEDRRCMRDGNGAADAGIGNGEVKTFKEFLGEYFFAEIDKLKQLGYSPDDLRILMGFDS